MNNFQKNLQNLSTTFIIQINKTERKKVDCYEVLEALHNGHIVTQPRYNTVADFFNRNAIYQYSTGYMIIYQV